LLDLWDEGVISHLEFLAKTMKQQRSFVIIEGDY